MLKRVAVGVGKALRDTGQAIERMGCRAQDNFIFNEPYCRHRAVMNLYDQRPRVAQGAFIAPNAAVIGNVDIEPRTSIWYGAVIRGDQSNIFIGGESSIGDRSVVQSSTVNPTGFSARTCIGDWVKIGQGCVLRACTIEDYCQIGDGCIVQEGALIENGAMLEPGSVVPQGARVPAGEVYAGNPATFVRKLSKEEIEEFGEYAEEVCDLAAKHLDEFLDYPTTYQLREQMAKETK
uniref:Putative gamma-type carbonic anhydrase n=1 Tax=Chrysotila haptonemofera TaxID=35135 RepID=Q0E9R6_CHRHP|nr:putative gamma-type carbonic anhydrase [Pleurochrysis haptonemofera]